DGLADIARPAQLALQHLARVRFVEEARLEIEAGGESHVGMAWAGVAVGTPMFASAVRVDRLFEGNVRGVVGADDRARAIGLEARRNAVRLLLDIPAVVHALDGLGFEASGRVGERPAPLEGLSAARVLAHASTVRPYSYPVKTPDAPAVQVRYLCRERRKVLRRPGSTGFTR